jgi:ubiquitin carboxyl-terminal hydrolase 7
MTWALRVMNVSPIIENLSRDSLFETKRCDCFFDLLRLWSTRPFLCPQTESRMCWSFFFLLQIRFRIMLERTNFDRSKRRRTGDALPPAEPLMTLAALNPRVDTGLVGLKNQGATCYMNSLLQGLFHLPCLRKAVYRIPVALGDDRVRSIPYQLQTLFVRMQLDAEAPDTKALTTSFGWTDEEAFEQHDVQEFARVLLDKVDEVMHGHPELKDVIKDLFEGQSQTYITCDGGFESIRDESFFDISLDIRGNASLLDSFRQYVAAEELKGSNQYRTPEGKMVDARKGSRFVRFPRVMQLQLKRFAYDPALDRMNKIDDMFSFAADLDLTDVLHSAAPADASGDESREVAVAAAGAVAAAAPRAVNPLADYVLHSVMVHSGGVHGGHYYAFVRPNPIGEPEKWFRLDDDRVAICAKAREAIEDNFGGSARPLLGAGVADVFRSKSDAELLSALAMDRQHSAYMLTYVRRSEAAVLLATVWLVFSLNLADKSDSFYPFMLYFDSPKPFRVMPLLENVRRSPPRIFRTK